MKVLILMAIMTLSIGISQAQDFSAPPQFEQYPFLLDQSVPKMDIDFALQWTDSLAMLFIAPYDAIVLHAAVDNQHKDIFIISDIGMNRLLIIQCAVDDFKERTIESITEYSGDGNFHLKAPSGLATTSEGRLFDPESDAIYVVERGANRILKLNYSPDEFGGKFTVAKIQCESFLHYPLDIALTDYGTGDIAQADMYVIEAGFNENEGALLRINLDGDLRDTWNEIYLPGVERPSWHLNQPSNIACYYNPKLEKPVLCVTEKTSNSIFFLSVTSDTDPLWEWSYTMQIANSVWEPGGIAVDDFGRIYAANSSLGAIETFSPEFVEYLPPFGTQGTGTEQFMHPSNILIDTYNGFREALILEMYGRQSGLQTYIIDEEIPLVSQVIGFQPKNIAKRVNIPENPIPAQYLLGDAYPNPFNGSCLIEFDIPKTTNVNIALYDILGRKVVTIEDRIFEPGHHSTKLSSGELSSGTYFYRMKAGNFTDIKSLILVK